MPPARTPRAVLVGLRGAVPVGVQGRRAARRRAAAADDPVRDQGPDPAVRRARGPGLRRLLPVHLAGGHGRRRRRRVACGRCWRERGTSLEAALPILEEARNWQQGERWGTYNIQRTYLRVPRSRSASGRRPCRRSATAPVDRAGELVFYNLGKFSQAISDFEQINFQSDAAGQVRLVREMAASTRRRTTTRRAMPTSGMRPRTR